MMSIGAYSAYQYSPAPVAAQASIAVPASEFLLPEKESNRFAPIDQASAAVSVGAQASDEQDKATDNQRAEEQKRAQLAEAEAELQRVTQQEISELSARDREVRTHEQAHKAVGGQYAGAVQYEYDRGPDGRLYAIGGEVGIDTAPVPGDPQATIEKMEQVRRAALAPAEPSGQDLAVAAQAAQAVAQARAELATAPPEKQERAETPTSEEPDDDEVGDSAAVSSSSARELSLYRDIANSAISPSGAFDLRA